LPSPADRQQLQLLRRLARLGFARRSFDGSFSAPLLRPEGRRYPELLGSNLLRPRSPFAAELARQSLPQPLQLPALALVVKLFDGFAITASASSCLCSRRPAHFASSASVALFARSSARSWPSPGSAFSGCCGQRVQDAGGIEEAGNAVRRLGADRQPVRDAIGVESRARESASSGL
jgi:hypothetical protein